MDLTKAILPEAVMVSGRYFKIFTGHSYWFRFAEIIDQEKVYLGECDFLYDGDKPDDRQAGIDALGRFYYEPKILPRIEGSEGGRIVDYAIDADLIYASILQCYGIDLYAGQLHWHRVRAMISGLHGTKYNEILGYRCATPGKNKELASMKTMWELPEKQTEDDSEILKKIADQFYNA